MPSARQEFGAEAEKLVAQWYEDNGYFILDRNWRCAEGEIDLILRRDRVVVFCEVKARTNTDFGLPVEAVTTSKQWKIRKTARRWVTENGAPIAGELRFDIASVLNDEISLLEDAF